MSIEYAAFDDPSQRAGAMAQSLTHVMHLVIIAWLYVALMMAVAEATNSTGTVLGAIFTFLLYGLLPLGLVVYIMGAPARRRANQAREQALREAAMKAAADSVAPDQGGEAPADPVPPVRKEP
jgi:hypothetical protein